MKTTTSERILTLIEKHKRVKSEGIIKHIGLTDRAVYKSLNKLVSSGQLVRHGTPPKVYYSLGSAPINIDTSCELIDVPEVSQVAKLSEALSPVVNICLLIQKDGKFLVLDSYGQLELPHSLMKYYDNISVTVQKMSNHQLKGLKFNIPESLNVVQTIASDKSFVCSNICYLCDYISGCPTNEKVAWVDRKTLGSNKRLGSETTIILGETYKYFDDKLARPLIEKHRQMSHIVMFDSLGQIILLRHRAGFYSYSSNWDVARMSHIIGHSTTQSANLTALNLYGVHPMLQYKRKGYKKGSMVGEEYHLYFGVSDGPYYINKEIFEETHSFDCEKILKGYYDKSYDFTSEVYDYVLELKDVWRNLQEGGVF